MTPTARWLFALPFCPLFACAQAEMPPPAGDPVPALTWQKTLPTTDSLRFVQRDRGLRPVRGLIHLHSVYSHDACDGKPQVAGGPNAPCLANLRRGLCATRQDFAFLTDHATLMADTPFPDLFLPDAAAGDEAEYATGDPSPDVDVVGGRLRCDDSVAAGHRVHVAVGGENELMPVALRRHLGSTAEARHQAMGDGSPAAVRAFHDAGGALLVAHGESHPIEQLRGLAQAGMDGMEVYNLHANIDPKIRGPYLGLDPLGAIVGLTPWIAGRSVEEGGPEPDLAFLGFLSANQSQIDKFDTLLGEGFHLAPTLGSDIHENSLKEPLADGERGDGYRRLMRWFTNHLLVPTSLRPLTTAGLRGALAAGRIYGVFELFGSPEGFDFHAMSGAQTFELGDTAPLGSTLRVSVPHPFPSSFRGADVVMRISVRHVPARGPGASGPPSSEVLTRTLTADELATDPGLRVSLDSAMRGPGAYRVEVYVVPRHLLHLLGENPAPYAREYPYLYTAPIYVR